jgi:hypothetical protein
VKLRYTLRGAAELDEVLADIKERSPQVARHVQAVTHPPSNYHARVTIENPVRRRAARIDKRAT